LPVTLIACLHRDIEHVAVQRTGRVNAMEVAVVAPNIPAEFDFTDPDVYAHRVPSEEFAGLRHTAPVWWNTQQHNIAGFGDDGYCVVSRHEDVKKISKDSELFSSEENTAIIRFDENIGQEGLDAQKVILLNMDPPQHTKVRRIVSKGFTPRAVNRLEATLRERAEKIAAEAGENGSGDFVTDIACELPLQAIAELLGVPQEDRGKVFDWSNQMVG